MVITMTNRLLAIVIAFALSSGIIAHAAQDSSIKKPVLPLPHLTLGEQATPEPAPAVFEEVAAAIDPRAPIRDAYVRDQVALEHLRQSASKLSSKLRPGFNAQISDDEAKLVDIERTALASSNPSSSSVKDMDKLVASATATLAGDEAKHESDGSEHSSSSTHSSESSGTGTQSSQGSGSGTHSGD